MVSLKKLSPAAVLQAGYAGMFFFVPVATSPTVLCGGVVLLVWICSGRFITDFKEWRKSEIALPVLMLVVLPWIGLIYTPSPEDGLSVALKTHYWLYALAIPPVIGIQRESDRVIKMFLAGLSLNSAISILQFLGIVPLKKGLMTGLLGGSSAHIAYSLLLTAGVLMASFYFFNSCSKRERVLYAVLMLQYFLVLGFTGGRSGYISLMLLSPFVVFNIVGRRGIVKILIFSILGLALLFTSPVVRSRFEMANKDITLYRQGEVNTSLGLRFHMWEIAWSDIKKSPFLGVGTAGFKESWETYKKDPSLPFIFHPHNSFIFMMVSYGILGLAAFCWLLWVIVKRGWKGRDSALGFAVFAFSITFIIGSLSDTQVLVFATAVALPLFSGISETLVRYERPTD